MRIHALFHGRTFFFGCSNDFAGKLTCHALFVALARVTDQPLHCHGNFAVGTDLLRNLKSRSTYTTAAHLYVRHNVGKGRLPLVKAIGLTGALRYQINGIVEDFEGG